MKDWRQIIEKPPQENLTRVGSNSWQNFLDQGSRIAISLVEQMEVYLGESLKLDSKKFFIDKTVIFM